MPEDMIRPRKLPTRVRLAKVDHTTRNIAQLATDMAGTVQELSLLPHQVAGLRKDQSGIRRDYAGLRDLISTERRAYAGSHAQDLAAIARAVEIGERVEKEQAEQRKATEKLTATINRWAGGLAALGGAFALLKFLLDTRHH